MIRARRNLLVALPAEAKPLNRLWGLRRLQPDGEFPLYVGHDLVLVVSGPGMPAMQAAVDDLHRRNGHDCAVWLNIGIAGHADLPLGQLNIAPQVVDTTRARRWRLSTPALDGCARLPVHTVAGPVRDYPGQAVFDMEAAAFVAAALQWAPSGRIHVIKLISDNRDHTTQQINARMVKNLFLRSAKPIDRLVNSI